MSTRLLSSSSDHTPFPGKKLGKYIVEKRWNNDVHNTADTADTTDTTDKATPIGTDVHNFSSTVIPLLEERPRLPDSKRPRSPDSQTTITQTSPYPLRRDR